MKKEVMWFAVAGAIGFVVDTTALYAAMFLGAGSIVGRLFSFMLAVWTTWLINRRFTFRKGQSESAWNEWWRYLLAMSAGGLVNFSIYSAIVLSFPASPLLPLFAVAAGAAVGMFVNYVSAKFWVFQQPTR